MSNEHESAAAEVLAGVIGLDDDVVPEVALPSFETMHEAAVARNAEHRATHADGPPPARLFRVERDGETIAEAVMFSDGSVAMKWRALLTSLVYFNDLASLQAQLHIDQRTAEGTNIVFEEDA
jgi:hypothetical protein